MSLEVDGYKIHLRKRLGSGGFGTVYKATSKEGILVAAKEIDLTISEKSAVREIENAVKQKQLENPHIAKIFHIHNDDEIWMFLEYCSEGDLTQYSKTQFADLQKNKFELMYQMVDGLCFLHKRKIAHRDVKPENILVQQDLTKEEKVVVKLADFGLAKFQANDAATSAMETNVGTPWYKAPEFWDAAADGSISYHKSVDVFALGLTYLAILQAKEGQNLKPAAVGRTQAELLQPIGLVMFNRNSTGQAKLVVLEEGSAEELQFKQQQTEREIDLITDIIRRATVFKPSERLTAKEVKTLFVQSKVVEEYLNLISMSPEELLAKNIYIGGLSVPDGPYYGYPYGDIQSP